MSFNLFSTAGRASELGIEAHPRSMITTCTTLAADGTAILSENVFP